MQPHDWLWLLSIAVGGFVAWQNLTIRAAILDLKIELIERIAKTEGDVKVLSAKQ